MKSIKINCLMIAFVGLFSSCEQELESPDFDVIPTITKTSLLGDDGITKIDAYEVKFTFSGNARNIVFYSGESGAEYRYRNRYYRDVVTKVQFSSNYSADIGNMPNTLRIMASNDFKPEEVYRISVVNSTTYTKKGVEAATWTDITDRFNLPGNSLTTGAQPSREATITEYNHDVPLFIAFRFDADKSSNISLSPGEWAFTGFQIRNYFEDETFSYYINNVLDNNWKKVDLADSTSYTVSGNTIRLNANMSPSGKPTRTVKTMVISRPFYPSHINSDKGLVVKSMEEKLAEYTYVYENPQAEAVRVAFVATNSLLGETIQEVKELEIVFPKND